MKAEFKRVLSLVLAITIIVSVMIGLDVSVFATENPEPTVVTEVPTEEKTDAPTEIPTQAPTQAATEDKTEAVTEEKTEVPTEEKTEAPTEEKTEAPTSENTEVPTMAPDEPTQAPTQTPAEKPSAPELKTQKRPKVNTVKGLAFEKVTADSAEIKWESVKGATGYIVYIRNSDETEKFTKQCTTTQPFVTVNGLEHTTAYQFKVVAFVNHKGKMVVGKSAYAETMTEIAATKAPTLKRSSTIIEFTWNKNARADGYVIYRKTKLNDEFKEYKKITDNATTIYTDESITAGTTYYYTVKAYRKPYDKDTYYSTGDTMKTVAGLSAPGHVSVTSQLRRVSLVWNKNKQAHGYYIYYSTEKNGEFKLMKDTKNTFYNTNRLTTGQQYYFRVVPYRVVGDEIFTGTWLAENKVVTDKAYDKEIGNTYIEVSIKQQRMWFYIDGELYVETPVVTGNVGYYSTPTGAYTIYQKLSPATLVGPTWSTPVDYWMAFTYSGCGIHDAQWRSNSEFGGSTYQGNGSHGCVNTPLDKVKKIYGKAKIGTPVVVY